MSSLSKVTAAAIEGVSTTRLSVRASYERLLDAARAFGPFQEEPKNVHPSGAKTAFAGVATQKAALILTVKADSDHPGAGAIGGNGHRPTAGISSFVWSVPKTLIAHSSS